MMGRVPDGDDLIVRLRRVAHAGAALLTDEVRMAMLRALWPAGARGRGDDGRWDLYYGFFALECLEALRESSVTGHARELVDQVRAPEAADVVHTCCFARILWRLRDEGRYDAEQRRVLGRLRRARRLSSRVYDAFLLGLALQERGHRLVQARRLQRLLRPYRRADGSMAGETTAVQGSTPVTAAVVTSLAAAGVDDPAALDWLWAQSDVGGGFRAWPGAPQPDLLSTGVALTALHVGGRRLRPAVAATVDFVERCVSGDGLMRAMPGVPGPGDSEYTYYGLMALGSLVA